MVLGKALPQCVLYIINAITASFGLAVAILCIYAITLHESVAFPRWLLPLGIAFGGAVFVVSLCGCHGASTAPRHLLEDSCNIPLWFYFLVVLLSLGCQIYLAITFWQMVNTLDDAQGGSTSSNVQDFDNDFIDWAHDNPSDWKDTQNHFDCCGYQTTTGDLATGDLCTSQADTVQACRTTILSKAKDQADVLAIVIIAFGAVELIALLCTCCLLCGRPAYYKSSYNNYPPTLQQVSVQQPYPPTSGVYAPGSNYAPTSVSHPAYVPAAGTTTAVHA